MKVFMSILIWFSVVSPSLQDDTADAYCVMSVVDQQVIESKNMHRPQSVASISKIMSAIIAIEQGNLKDTWKVSDAILSAHGSSIYLKQGQDVSLESLLYGLMLRSGNDAAIEIATHISGSEKAFVQEMNRKGKEIGMLNTTFHNPSGLDDEQEGNISTAYDMAILMSYAMKNMDFRKITSTKYYNTDWNLRWKNKNRLLFDYEYANGGKTGFTKKAGRTLVSSASKDDLEVVVVTLQTPDDFAFHKEKHEQVFNDYQLLDVLKKGKYIVNQHEVDVKQKLSIAMKKDGSETLQVNTHIEEGELVVEIAKNEQRQIYDYKAKSIAKSWWQRLLP